jgi:hypothetical protein
MNLDDVNLSLLATRLWTSFLCIITVFLRLHRILEAHLSALHPFSCISYNLMAGNDESASYQRQLDLAAVVFHCRKLGAAI